MELGRYPFSARYGWLKDKFGVSWQIVPTRLSELMADKDPEKVKQVTKAMLQMKKLEIKQLEEVFRGSGPAKR